MSETCIVSFRRALRGFPSSRVGYVLPPLYGSREPCAPFSSSRSPFFFHRARPRHVFQPHFPATLRYCGFCNRPKIKIRDLGVIKTEKMRGEEGETEEMTGLSLCVLSLKGNFMFLFLSSLSFPSHLFNTTFSWTIILISSG